MKLKGCRLTEKQQDRLVEFFVGEMTACTAADLVGINKTTGAYFFHRLRAIIAWQLDEASPLAGEVEADESYFGGKRKGKRGRGAAGKVPVFGILKRGGKVWIQIFPDNPVTEKLAESRLGSGKGNPERWVARVKPGRIMFELSYPDPEVARAAIERAIQKLPIKARFVMREEEL